jgi:hypothetical protein
MNLFDLTASAAAVGQANQMKHRQSVPLLQSVNATKG